MDTEVEPLTNTLDYASRICDGNPEPPGRIFVTNIAMHAAAQDAKAAGFPRMRDTRILVVEDNDLGRKIAMGLLKLLGITPTLAANGEEAVALCEGILFDLILMDIQMPVMDGVEATRRIRASTIPGVRDIPIIAMTASSLFTETIHARDAGMDGLITKPISQAELANTIRHWCGNGSGPVFA